MNVERHAVEAQRLDLLEHIKPERWDWETEGVKLSTEDHDALAIDQERMLVPSHDVLQGSPPFKASSKESPGLSSDSVRAAFLEQKRRQAEEGEGLHPASRTSASCESWQEE